MSIDARVVGLRKVKNQNVVKLNLEDRPPDGIRGQETLMISVAELQKTKAWLTHLKHLVGRDIWGGSSDIMLGNTRLAYRDGYTRIRLVDDWVEVIQKEVRADGR